VRFARTRMPRICADKNFKNPCLTGPDNVRDGTVRLGCVRQDDNARRPCPAEGGSRGDTDAGV
jgi:hypothetical protein